jgi:2-oxoglutarate ferredoxin oxidoreductase subunit beta
MTGLLYVDESVPDLHELSKTPATALSKVPYEQLCPGSAALDKLQNGFR